MTGLAGRQVMADARQHDWLSIRILCGHHLSVRILRQNLPGDAALRTEPANLSEVQVVQLFEQPGSLVLGKLREQVVFLLVPKLEPFYHDAYGCLHV